jgi:hypothetical protein
VFATDLPTGEDGGFYRWHVNSFQMQTVRDVPDDRWKALKTDGLAMAKHRPPHRRCRAERDL